MRRAAARLKNNKSPGPDKLPAELFKYAPDSLFTYLAELYTMCVETGQHLTLGSGELIPLQKPGKPRGPGSSLRPIVLLNALRKVLSLVVLARITPRVQAYVSQMQSGFRPNRSTTDVVWAHRWIAARCQHLQSSISILGIDMSRAFDTISRRKLVNVLRSFLEPDEVRLVQLLVSDTTLSARIKNTQSRPFATTSGTPQGDSLSPVLFIIYLETALRHVFSCIPPRPNLDITLNLPPSLGYADDVDFVSTSSEYLDSILPIVGDCLADWDLKVNQAKTERTTIQRKKDRVEEEWRRTRKLGSLIGDKEDVARRIQIASGTFNKMWPLWSRGHLVSEKLRVRLYEAFIKPLLMYNAGTWGLSDSQLCTLDSTYRRHLRVVVGIRYPQIISNDDLHRRTETQPLTVLVKAARMRLLGHICRLDKESPAQMAMTSYFRQTKDEKKFRGRPPSTLPTILRTDLATKGMKLQTDKDLSHIRDLAEDRAVWRQLFRT